MGKPKILALVLFIAIYASGGCQTSTTIHPSKIGIPSQKAHYVNDETHFYFVQITDTHFGDGDHMERTIAAVKRINNLPMPIQCVVHTGDITTNKLDDNDVLNAVLAVFKKIKVPIHYVPGNHDILPQKITTTHQAYVENFGSLISQAEYEKVIFLFVYTEPLRKSFTIKNYHPLKQLEEYLDKAGGKPVIIFHHAPSVDDFYQNKMHKSWETDSQEKWIHLLNSHNVKAVIAGHFHRDEHHWLGKIPLYISSPIAGYWGRQATFRIYEFRNGRLGYRTQYIR